MSQYITTAMINAYENNITHLLQQMGSKLRGTTQEDYINGEFKYYEQLNTTSMKKRTSRYADMPIANTEFKRRRVTPEDYDLYAELCDKLDLQKTLVDPKSSYATNATMAAGRQIDDILFDAFFATADTGKDGSTGVPFPNTSIATGGNVIVQDYTAANDGMTLAKLIAAKQVLDEAEVEDDNRYIAMAPQQFSELLAIEKVTSSDYASIKALVQGQIDSYLGFKFIRSNRLAVAPDITSGLDNTQQIPVWNSAMMQLGIGSNPTARFDDRPDKAGVPIQLSMTMSMGATRLQEPGVYKIESYLSTI